MQNVVKWPLITHSKTFLKEEYLGEWMKEDQMDLGIICNFLLLADILCQFFSRFHWNMILEIQLPTLLVSVFKNSINGFGKNTLIITELIVLLLLNLYQIKREKCGCLRTKKIWP